MEQKPSTPKNHKAWGGENKPAPQHRAIRSVREHLQKDEIPTPSEPIETKPLTSEDLIRHRPYRDQKGQTVIFQRTGFKVIHGEEVEVAFVSEEINPGFEKAIPLSEFLANNETGNFSMTHVHFRDPRTMSRKNA